MDETVLQWFGHSGPVLMALFATLFTWGVTAAGAALVFLTNSINRRVFDGLLGMAAGVMIAASFWSLLAPAIEMAPEGFKWQTALIGFMGGGLFLFGIDKVLPHLHPGLAMSQAEGVHTNWQRSILLVLAITLHNIPEGLAVGVGFGALGMNADFSNPATLQTFGAAVALAFGIGLQNFPEGAAVSMPLRREGFSQWRAFWYGQASGIVEPIAAVIGAYAVMTMSTILPYALAFAAGAMIFVAVEELIPESQGNGNTDIATLGTLAGFSIMMSLDVGLG